MDRAKTAAQTVRIRIGEDFGIAFVLLLQPAVSKAEAVDDWTSIRRYDGAVPQRQQSRGIRNSNRFAPTERLQFIVKITTPTSGGQVGEIGAGAPG